MVAQEIMRFTVLPDGRLLSPWDEVFLSVEESRQKFEQWVHDYIDATPLPLPELQAIRKIMQKAVFDPVCGHWIATEREKRGYFYVSMKYAGKQREVGVHAVSQMVLGAKFAPEQRKDGIMARPPVDHRCRLHACFNPWHTRVTSTAENTRAGIQARRDLELHEAGYRPLIGRHELAP